VSDLSVVEKKKGAKPGSAPKPPRKTLTFWNGDERFEVPVLDRVPGFVYVKMPAIVEAYEKELSGSIPAAIRTLNAMPEGEAKEEYQREHQAEIVEYNMQLIARMARIKSGDAVVGAAELTAKYNYMQKAIRLILKTDGLTDEQKALIESEPDSEFWENQDYGGEIADALALFRRRMG
jgi:hypothetical protein